MDNDDGDGNPYRPSVYSFSEKAYLRRKQLCRYVFLRI